MVHYVFVMWVDTKEGCINTKEGWVNTKEGCINTKDGWVNTKEGCIVKAPPVFLAPSGTNRSKTLQKPCRHEGGTTYDGVRRSPTECGGPRMSFPQRHSPKPSKTDRFCMVLRLPPPPDLPPMGARGSGFDTGVRRGRQDSDLTNSRPHCSCADPVPRAPIHHRRRACAPAART